jgi:hypothetical protein
MITAHTTSTFCFDCLCATAIIPISDAPLGMTLLPIVPDDEFGAFWEISQMREAIVEYIREHDIRRPMHNIERQRKEQW